MLIKTIFSLLLFVFGIYCEDSVRHYNGYSVLRLIPKTETQLNYLRELENNVIELDFWRGPSYLNREVDVMVPPQLNHTFDKMFSKKNFEKTILIDDLEKQILEERAVLPSIASKPSIWSPSKPTKVNSTRADIIPNYFDTYQRMSNIYNFLSAIQTQYSSISSVTTIGKSYEGRELRLIKIGVNQSSNTKPIIFLESGIHAREWISPATSQCFAQNLVQGYESNNADIVAILTKFDFYIIPVLNADGYEYTHSRDRMWRKTRKPYGSCYGADPNRNFGHQWGGQGASTNPCSETYRGPNAFSEPVTKAESDYILSIKTRVKAFFAIHSYGQYWLYPWGYSSALTPHDRDLNRMANIATSALRQLYGTTYTVGTSTNVLYAAAGGADDWAYGGAGVKYSYTAELRDKGTYGFTLPASQIRPTCAETTLAFIAFAKQLATEV